MLSAGMWPEFQKCHHPNKKEPKNSQSEYSWRSGCHTNRVMISFCLLRGEKKQRVAFPLDSRALFNCLLHKIKFISRYTCRVEKDGTHNHGTALNSVSVFCIIRKRCAETSDSGGALVEMCFCFCLFMRSGECLLSVLSTRLLQDWNLNAGPHCEEHTETHRWDLFIKQTAFTDEELAKYLELLLETCIKPSWS